MRNSTQVPNFQSLYDYIAVKLEERNQSVPFSYGFGALWLLWPYSVIHSITLFFLLLTRENMLLEQMVLTDVTIEKLSEFHPQMLATRSAGNERKQ